MVFNSVQFLVFFVVVYALYRLLPRRGQNWLLLAASYYFYAAWDWRFLSLLVGSTLIDYTCGLVIARERRPRRRKALVAVSIAFNLGMLGFFKYFNFFAQNLQALAEVAGFSLDFVTLRVLLPIGISFYTFMTMSYVIDVYRGAIEPTRNLRDFALFVAYFPHLVAGPILRASTLLPQIQSRRAITREQIVTGSWLIAWGFFKKIFVADNLGHLVDRVFASAAQPSGFEVLVACYAFAFQIYGDFSGYSDIARGTSRLMGIELIENFRFPYLARTPQEFWRHWHISLSTWLRDYLYVPLGGNRGTPWQTRRNLLVTMVLGGLWHGAQWTFVLWGAYQGLLLVLYRIAAARRPRGDPAPAAGRGAAIFSRLLMFHLTCYGWLIFRAGSVGQIASLTKALMADFSLPPDVLSTLVGPLVFYTWLLIAVHAIEAARDDLLAVLRLPVAVRYTVFGAVAFLTLLFGDFAGTEFIYFQF